jgi:hypothetical protein
MPAGILHVSFSPPVYTTTDFEAAQSGLAVALSHTESGGGGMKPLLHENAKCNNGHQCPQRETCLRWITPSCGPDQIDAAFSIAGVEHCSGYWPAPEGTA